MTDRCAAAIVRFPSRPGLELRFVVASRVVLAFAVRIPRERLRLPLRSCALPGILALAVVRLACLCRLKLQAISAYGVILAGTI